MTVSAQYSAGQTIRSYLHTIKIAQQHIKMKHSMRSVVGKGSLALCSAATQAGIEWISSSQASRK